MTDLTVFRVYEPHECGGDGYPLVWHDARATGHDLVAPEGVRYGVKDLVREEAGHRCVRCGHPFVVGKSSVHEAESIAAAVVTLIESNPNGDRAFALSPQGEGKRPINWSPCDALCTHQGPFRFRYGRSDWVAIPAPPEGELVLGPRGYLHLENGAEVHAAWRILTVHHLNGRKHDLRWWNLAALCQRCHLVIQRKVQMERVYPFEHTPWFRPYVAGYYALCYEGRDITRQEAEARADELLAYERMV